jgi:hypothetical protein
VEQEQRRTRACLLVGDAESFEFDLVHRFSHRRSRTRRAGRLVDACREVHGVWSEVVE